MELCINVRDWRHGWVAEGGKLVEELFEPAISGKEGLKSLDFGPVSDEIRTKYDMSLEARKQVRADGLGHIQKEHGVGNEKDPTQIPVRAEHTYYIPMIMEYPDKIQPPQPKNRKKGEIRHLHIMDVPGIGVFHPVVRTTKRHISPVSMWIKKRNDPRG